MAISMRREFPCSLTHLRSHDVKIVIFLNTDVTSSFLMLKTSSKNILYIINTKSTYYCVDIGQKHYVNYDTMLTKIFRCYQ